MANVQIEIQRVSFDISDPELTKVVVEIKHNDDGILLKNRYENKFPARIPLTELLEQIFTSTNDNHYLKW